MKTMKALVAISAILLGWGYAYAGPGDSDDVNNTVREKIAAAIQSADIQASGEVVLKFGVTEKSGLQIINVESNDKYLSKEVKEALAGTSIVFPKGSQGLYKIKVHVNEAASGFQYDQLRSQVVNAVEQIESNTSESVNVKVRVVSPSTLMVLKAESDDPALAAKVKKSLESEGFVVPKEMNGDYNVKVTFK